MVCKDSSMHRSIQSSMLLPISLLVAITALSGCSSRAEVDTRSTTVGQELQDLDEARNKGLITEQEFQQKRKEIMKSK